MSNDFDFITTVIQKSNNFGAPLILVSSSAVARNTNADEARGLPSKIWSCLMMYQPDDLMQISELNDGTLVDGLWTLFDVFSKL